MIESLTISSSLDLDLMSELNFLLLASALQSKEVWSPPHGLLFGILVLGAILIAGVFLMIFSFYEDYYWGDQEYREQLRWNSSRRKKRA